VSGSFDLVRYTIRSSCVFSTGKGFLKILSSLTQAGVEGAQDGAGEPMSLA